MKHTTSELHTEVTPGNYSPTQEQIDAFARRMAPVIQQFFVDAEMQKEFSKWQEKHSPGKS